MVGLSYLRLREFEMAETPLTRASVLGDLEAMVELGNLLRLMGRFEEAIEQFLLRRRGRLATQGKALVLDGEGLLAIMERLANMHAAGDGQFGVLAWFHLGVAV